jgi:hypothetical protein
MSKSRYTALTAEHREAWESARLKEISLKWAKIARAKAREDSYIPKGVIAKIDPIIRDNLAGIPPVHALRSA